MIVDVGFFIGIGYGININNPIEVQHASILQVQNDQPKNDSRINMQADFSNSLFFEASILIKAK